MLIPVIGLEVHIELNTKSKMFCACENNPFGSIPNSLTCPTCLGLPGALPVPNKAALDSTMLLGLALGSQINLASFFERKNYFYPDLPKGYQISQYQKPLCVGGNLQLTIDNLQLKTQESKTIRINRIHQEEDTAKLMHEGEKTLIDFNRSGVPLAELVTEADFRDAASAKAFLKELTKIVKYLDISTADMEKGTMRLEANISLQEEGSFIVKEAKVTSTSSQKLNPKVEVKNINSFRFVEKAVNYEIKRQTEAIEKGQLLTQETRGYDEKTGQTYSQREKESAHDYRYFPEPDIPPLEFDETYVNKLRQMLPELPAEKVNRWLSQDVKQADAEILSETKELADLFDESVGATRGSPEITGGSRPAPTIIANLLVNKPDFQKKSVGEIVTEVKKMLDKPTLSPTKVAELCKQAIKDNPKAVADCKKGKEAGLKFLIGQVMRLSNGSAELSVVENLLKSFLE